MTKALELVAAGAIGRVVHTTGLGPHRHNPQTRARPGSTTRRRSGGILCDIGSHQIDQFMLFTGSTEVEIVGRVDRQPRQPAAPGVRGLRPDAAARQRRRRLRAPGLVHRPTRCRPGATAACSCSAPRARSSCASTSTWRAGPGTDHLFLVNGQRCEHIDASGAGMPYFARLADDVRHRTETAMQQTHCFQVMDLALRAQAMADAQRQLPGQGR